MASLSETCVRAPASGIASLATPAKRTLPVRGEGQDREVGDRDDQVDAALARRLRQGRDEGLRLALRGRVAQMLVDEARGEAGRVRRRVRGDHPVAAAAERTRDRDGTAARRVGHEHHGPIGARPFHLASR
jgi:hypothetical protein